MMLDGIELHGRTNIVALGITTEGEKLALGLWDGSTENATVAAALLSDLVDRGPGRRAGHAVRDRRLESALNAVANFEFERLIDRVRGPRRRNQP